MQNKLSTIFLIDFYLASKERREHKILFFAILALYRGSTPG